jgi:FtsZ-binding cell division protein ZapB
METLMKEINALLEDKNTTISLLQWEVEKLKKEIADLKNDIEKYKENEAKNNE